MLTFIKWECSEEYHKIKNWLIFSFFQNNTGDRSLQKLSVRLQQNQVVHWTANYLFNYMIAILIDLLWASIDKNLRSTQTCLQIIEFKRKRKKKERIFLSLYICTFINLVIGHN